jgi:hypothetical protein
MTAPKRLEELAQEWDRRAAEAWQAASDQSLSSAGAGLRACVASTYEKCAKELREAGAA